MMLRVCLPFECAHTRRLTDERQGDENQKKKERDRWEKQKETGRARC